MLAELLHRLTSILWH